ncbi:MAG: TatD family hydrolase [Clostridiales Family XIII bacterium]|nr:TatD family hydrolase [Clostridiales Family XIII bacterium]
MKQLFDSHAHINADECTGQQREMLAHSIETSEVAYVIDVGYDMASSRRAVENAAKYPWCFAAVGIHPLYIPDTKTHMSPEAHATEQDVLSGLELLANMDGVRAVGEIGLDYHMDDTPRAVQQRVFREQIRLALRLKLPITIHDRDSHEDVCDILKEEGVFGAVRKAAFPENPQTGQADARVLLHAYSGSAEQALQYVKLGASIGIGGTVTYENNRKAAAVAAVVPLANLLIETDAPFMAPEPFRGSPNASPLIRYTAAKIAEIKEISIEALAAATMENGKRFFNIV